jgi:hypothetical protein
MFRSSVEPDCTVGALPSIALWRFTLPREILRGRIARPGRNAHIGRQILVRAAKNPAEE